MRGLLAASEGAMKPHRPWQPHMGNSPLFNPYTPVGTSTTIDHYDLVEEQEAETEQPAELPPEEADAPPPAVKRD